MKKNLILLAVVMSLASVALAGINDQTNPGDPKKENKEKASFGFSKNYFNLFSIFDLHQMKPDSLTSPKPRPVMIHREEPPKEGK